MDSAQGRLCLGTSGEGGHRLARVRAFSRIAIRTAISSTTRASAARRSQDTGSGDGGGEGGEGGGEGGEGGGDGRHLQFLFETDRGSKEGVVSTVPHWQLSPASQMSSSSCAQHIPSLLDHMPISFAFAGIGP